MICPCCGENIEPVRKARHRIACGDCTDPDVVASVMRGEKADMLATDPPYGVDYHGNFIHSGKILEEGERIWQGGITNDKIECVGIIKKSFDVVTEVLKDGAACLVCAPPGRRLREFLNAWPDAWHFQAALVWDKQSLIISRWDYHPQHEMILFGWKRGTGHRWYGGTRQSTVWGIARHQGTGYEHPTEKPVELYERGIANHSRPGDVIIDSFVGSGTCLVACERLARRGRGIELDPGYCAVAIQRLVDMGLEAKLIQEIL